MSVASCRRGYRFGHTTPTPPPEGIDVVEQFTRLPGGEIDADVADTVAAVLAERDLGAGAWSNMAKVWTVSTNATGTVAGRLGDIAIYRYTPVSGYTAAQMGGPKVFIGDGNSPLASRRTVSGTTYLVEDANYSNVLTSGATTGETSPDWVSAVNTTVGYDENDNGIDDYFVKGMTAIEHSSECTKQGDSGGAVYRISSSGSALAVGIISGGIESGPLFFNCRIHYSPVSHIYFGGWIETG